MSAKKQRARARNLAHAHFDSLWKSGRMSRRTAYAVLAACMRMTTSECHISQMKPKTCRKVVWACMRMQGKSLEELKEDLEVVSRREKLRKARKA